MGTKTELATKGTKGTKVLLIFVIFVSFVADRLCVLVAAQQPPEFVSRVGAYLEQYYARAQRIVATEYVTMQPLTRDMGFDGFARHLVYELRVEWNPAAADGAEPATVVRHLISATGPRLGPPGQPDCLDPRALSPEPLAFLLPSRQHKFTFRMAGPARVGGGQAVTLEFRPVASEPPRVEWNDQCGRIDLPGRTRGRVWVDPQTAEILRFDEQLIGQVDIPGPPGRRAFGPMWFTVERADTSTYYQRVRFQDPDETLLLPSRIDSVSVIRNSGIPRMRVTQTFSNYRRFVTSSRVIE